MLETTGDCWSLGLTPSLPLLTGNVAAFQNEITANVPRTPLTVDYLHFCLHSYKPVTILATVSKDRAEIVDFRLTRVYQDGNGQTPSGPYPTQNPSEKELQSLIKELSLGQGLEQLVSSSATDSSFRYRSSKDLSAFLRGLTLNFPKITFLHRWVGSGFRLQLKTIYSL